jgi:glycosyltransferase involved in cell wall biosynthesis
LAIHVGNVSYARNPELTVDLLAELPHIHVAFVGAASAEIADAVQANAAARGVGDRLHFVPPVPLAELTGFISDADVSLIMLDGSRSRDTLYTMPNKLYDSLSAGVPVVAPEGSTAGEFLMAQQLGRDFKLNAPGQLASAVGTVLSDPALRDRVRSRAADFTWAQAEPTLFALVDGLIADSESDRDESM